MSMGTDTDTALNEYSRIQSMLCNRYLHETETNTDINNSYVIWLSKNHKKLIDEGFISNDEYEFYITMKEIL